ncbi:MAG: hypothetical protein FJ387_03025 [Verrucomicrobia bacterium]|nr:hypothetical protein [Verrucomicrobiota bacterium]
MTYILTAYIVLLLVGGLIGYVKAGSKVSLAMSLGFAAAIGLCVFTGVRHGLTIAVVLQLALLAVFVARYLKTKKFMPAGLMGVVTVLAVTAELAIQSVGRGS